MKRSIIPTFIAILTFYATLVLLQKIKAPIHKASLQIRTLVPENDHFQLFYSSLESPDFSEKTSSQISVKGSKNSQDISLDFPIHSPIKNIRLDIGNNRQQKPIKIESIQLKVGNQTKTLSLQKDFTFNRHIKAQGDVYTTSLVAGHYDPWFLSTANISRLLNQVSAPQQALSNSIIYGIALLFFICIFLSLYFKNIPAELLVSNWYILAFFIILLAPEFVHLFSLEKEGLMDEKRTLAPKPKLSFSPQFPKQYEAYYNDNFGLRSSIITFSNSLKTSFFRSSPKPDIAEFGEEGFIFLVSGYSVMPSYTNTNLFSKEKVEKTYQNIATRKANLAAQNIQYLIGYWPNKHTVYKSQLPKSMQQKIKTEQTLANQVIAYFKERNLDFLDVSPALFKAKKQKQLYQKFDTHWNDHGAFLAYQSFCKQSYSDLGLTPFEETDFNIINKKTRKGDLVYMLGMNEFPDYYDELPEYSLKGPSKGFSQTQDTSLHKEATVTINNSCPNKKTVLFFRDSYGKKLIPFLSLHFHKVVYIPCAEKDYYDQAIVDKVQPNIILSFSVERYIYLLLDLE